jgi:WD40 repeat protein
MNAEPDEDIPTTTIIPLEEVLIGTDVKIKGILFEENHYMIQDEAGFLKRVGYPGYATKNLVAHHAGPIAALSTSARAHFAVTVGHDGTVRLWDYVATRLVYTRKFNSGGTCLCMVPCGLDPEGRQV